MVERDLPCRQPEIDSPALVDFHDHFLSSRQQVVLSKGVVMSDLAMQVAARHDADAPVLVGAAGESEPSRDHFRRLESPVGRVLVP